VARCRNCGHIAVVEGLAIGEDGRSIYETEDSIFSRDGNADYYMDETRMLAAEAKVQFVRHYWAGNGPLLDIGAGFGHFLKAVGGGCAASGVELSPHAVAWSREHFGVRSDVGSTYDIPWNHDRPFQAVTCWDVIEHLEDPRRALAEMRAHLQEDGWLFLSTPDAGAAIARLMGRHWHYLDPIQHINLFSLRNLTRLLEDHGFRVEGAAHLGHAYRINYIVNRVSFLTGNGWLGSGVRQIGRAIPRGIRRRQLHIKLGDVMAVAARRIR
jgi:SAM-dependent methyltransferase